MLKRTAFALTRFAKLPFRRKLIYFDASFRLIAAYGLVRLVTFKHWRALLKQSPMVKAPEELNLSDLDFLMDLQHVLRQIKWGTRNRATCLMMVLIARWMLNRREIPGTIFLGVRRDAAKPGLHAHAWMNSVVGVVGYEDVECFVVVERFGG